MPHDEIDGRALEQPRGLARSAAFDGAPEGVGDEARDRGPFEGERVGECDVLAPQQDGPLAHVGVEVPATGLVRRVRITKADDPRALPGHHVVAPRLEHVQVAAFERRLGSAQPDQLAIET